MWELRDDVTAYDAAYVALAERLDAPVITCDGKLAAANGPRCVFDLTTRSVYAGDPLLKRRE